jgi:hypothetical protein
MMLTTRRLFPAPMPHPKLNDFFFFTTYSSDGNKIPKIHHFGRKKAHREIFRNYSFME